VEAKRSYLKVLHWYVSPEIEENPEHLEEFRSVISNQEDNDSEKCH
jgi:hypothetical protein